jgi:hypothetical protein
MLSNEVREMPTLSHDNKTSSNFKNTQITTLIHVDVPLLSATDTPFLTSLVKAQNKEEIDDQSYVAVSSNEVRELECMPENSLLAIKVTEVLLTMKQTYIDAFRKVLQSQQKRTLRRGAFRAWGMFARDMATEKRLCNVVCKIKLRTVRREVFHAWRSSGKNQIEALETEIETLTERVRVLEEQKTRQPDMDHIVSELAKRGLFVSTQSQPMQKTEAQSHVTEDQEAKSFLGSWNPLGSWVKTKTSNKSLPQEPPIKPNTESKKDETPLDLDSESEKDPTSDPESEPESIKKPSPPSMSKDAPPPPPLASAPTPPPMSGDAPPPPPPPPPPSESAKSTQQESGSPPQESGSTQSSSGKKAPSLITMTPQEELKLKDLRKKQINGTLKEVAKTEQEMTVILKKLEEYEIYLKSQPPRVTQLPGTSAKAQKINAKAKAALRQGSVEYSFNMSLLSAASFRKRQAEQESTQYSSDEEKQSINKEPSNVVEDKCDAKQETPAKETKASSLECNNGMMISDVPVDKTDSNTSDDDQLDFCFYAPTRIS